LASFFPIHHERVPLRAQQRIPSVGRDPIPQLLPGNISPRDGVVIVFARYQNPFRMLYDFGYSQKPPICRYPRVVGDALVNRDRPSKAQGELRPAGDNDPAFGELPLLPLDQLVPPVVESNTNSQPASPDDVTHRTVDETPAGIEVCQ